MNKTLEHVFRTEHGRIMATLIRLSGSFDLAEEALQEAFASAASAWKRAGTPVNPGAWLTTVARRKLVDIARRERTRSDKQRELEIHEPENAGLLALMLLQDSRRDARINMQGEFVTLEDQDRSTWDRAEIAEGLLLVERALPARRMGVYQLQAAIAAVHAEASTAAVTDWIQIAALYRELLRLNPSPVVALNHAVAVAMSEGYERGLRLIDKIGESGELDEFYLYHASRADLLRRLRRPTEAGEAYSRALELTTNRVEQQYIRNRLKEAGGVT